MTVDGGARFKKEGTWFYDIAAPGFKCNLPELSAALGLAQLSRRDELLAARRHIAARYTEAFRDHPIVRPPVVLHGREHCWHLYVIQLETDRMSIDRNRCIEELKVRNIGASVHFTPLYRHSFYRELLRDDPQKFPGCERAYRRIVSLPIWPGMAAGDVDDVIAALQDILK
jgi:dTDP-4-amino-4,6-dideoxygalactose transaminase